MDKRIKGVFMEKYDKAREHVHEYVHTHEHTHEHDSHTHGHTHSEEHKKRMLNRLSKAIGHLQSVKNMVENDADCNDVLVQLAAVKSAIGNTGKEIAKEHLTHCLTEAIENGSYEEVEEFNATLDKLLS